MWTSANADIPGKRRGQPNLKWKDACVSVRETWQRPCWKSTTQQTGQHGGIRSPAIPDDGTSQGRRRRGQIHICPWEALLLTLGGVSNLPFGVVMGHPRSIRWSLARAIFWMESLSTSDSDVRLVAVSTTFRPLILLHVYNPCNKKRGRVKNGQMIYLVHVGHAWKTQKGKLGPLQSKKNPQNKQKTVWTQNFHKFPNRTWKTYKVISLFLNF